MALSRNNNPLSPRERQVLFKACEQGDLVTLQSHLNSLSPAEISSIRDEQNATLVHYAARYGYVHILKYFVVHKNLNIYELRTDHGATCAHDAVVCDQVDALNYILHVDKFNNRDMEPTTHKFLWNVRDHQGNTPLHLAAHYDSIKCLRYLIEHESANPQIKTYNGFQPIHDAASSGHVECVKILLNAAPNTVNAQTNTLFTPSYLACQRGSLDTIKILCAHGANFSMRDENGLNCLHVACQNSHLHVVRWLVETQNANVNDTDYMGNTPLHYAAATGNEAILTYLLGNNAQVLISSNGSTPLHVAAENGHQGACVILIERGHCSVNAQNNSQLTPADLAAYYGFHTLANQLRLQTIPLPVHAKSSPISEKIQVENATIVRLVVKKRNVQRSDAANQVDENDIISNLNNPVKYSTNNESVSSKLTNTRFDLSELRARVEEHEASRTNAMTNGDTVQDVLMHSLDSLNQHNKNRPRSKLPSQTYAPWLKTGDMTPRAFEREIQQVGSNLRKVRRDSLLKKDIQESNIPEEQLKNDLPLGPPVMPFARGEQDSERATYGEFVTNGNRGAWKKPGSETLAPAVPAYKSYQNIATPVYSGSQPERPDWRRGVTEQRKFGFIE